MICTEVAYERKRNYNKIDNSWCNSYDYLLNCSPYVHELSLIHILMLNPEIKEELANGESRQRKNKA